MKIIIITLLIIISFKDLEIKPMFFPIPFNDSDTIQQFDLLDSGVFNTSFNDYQMRGL